MTRLSPELSNSLIGAACETSPLAVTVEHRWPEKVQQTDLAIEVIR